MTKLITTISQLPAPLRDSLTPAERVFIEGLEAAGRLPFAVTPHFASLAGPEAADPIRRQFLPDPREALSESGPFALQDPLGEAHFRACPRLIHQYNNRALLLAGGVCAGYCRHCFRRVRMSSAPAFISDDELAPALAYLRDHREIKEILVSGGDPLTAPDSALEALFTKLRGSQSRGSRQAAPSLRICTRVPVTAPERVTPELVELCRGFLRQPAEDAEDRLYRGPGLRFSVHINHPRELSPPTRQALDRLMQAGITVLVQTVLLRGVNDSAETLAALFDECHALGLTPYYLFQLDLAPGTAHFRVPLRQGLALYRDLQNSHLATNSHLPVYAVDLPGGGGKIRLGGESIAGEEERPGGRVYLLKAPDGGLWPYPA